MNETPKTSHTVLRVIVIGGILAILVFLSIGIVRIVPRALNALASASVSLGSVFSNNSNNNATSTPVRNNVVPNPSNNYAPTPNGVRATSTPVVQTNTPVVHTSNPTQTNAPVVTNGTPDLMVTIYSKGVINPANGLFTETNTFSSTDTVIVKFKVENVGNGATGPWSLRVTMPSSNANDQIKTFNSIASLPAGAAITGEARFDSPTIGNTTVTITADYLSTVRESNENNNTTTAALAVVNNGYNNGNGGYNGGITSVTPDLAIQILDTGVLNSNNQYIQTSTIRAYDRAAVRFRVTNQGQNPTGLWYFRADLNNNGGYNSSNYNNYYTNGYYSGYNNGYSYNNGVRSYIPTAPEASLAGGASTIYIVSFDGVMPGYSTITVSLDSANMIYEGNEGNNAATVNFNVVQ